MNRKRKISVAKATGIIVIGLVMVLGLLGGNIFNSLHLGGSNGAVSGISNDPVPCADPKRLVPEDLRMYPQVFISIDGVLRPMPKDIGVEPGCTRVIYTNDSSGTIHVEPQEKRAYSLGNFFSVWGYPFSSRQVLGRVADEDDIISMTVDGSPSLAFENLILQDKQEIVIKFQTVGAAAPPSFTVTIPGLQ